MGRRRRLERVREGYGEAAWRRRGSECIRRRRWLYAMRKVEKPWKRRLEAVSIISGRMKWKDEMLDTGVWTHLAPAPIHAGHLQAVAPLGGFPTAAPQAIMQDRAAGVVGNAQVDIRVMQQLKWLEKMVYVCTFLLFMLFSRSSWVFV
ncbi:hypothetical protein OsI_33327 [Oryza sativa Indica Group]|uniref:Uncharacterized protein n=1 Tax=Oryza sativa subsp. indica TaxID=39946 RepID=A2Z6P7_ORYSI|nr:hypothetical protein OsI_33327 [Oryza sativa Indica Group]